MTAVRPQIARLQAYVPGEQPQESGWNKLNTNENPYPCSPHVQPAVADACRSLHVYPDPLGTSFRKAASDVLGVDPDCILPANGSDENLTLLMRTYVDPGELVTYPYPSYVLYETLADIQGGEHVRLPLQPDWTWDLDATATVVERSKLVLVPNPNSPSGNLWDDETVLRLVPPNGILVIDEAYRDFADQPPDLQGLLDGPAGERIVITRTLSKSYSLAGLRLGFAVARPERIAEMRKVKDSYNCDALALAGGVAALRDQDFMRRNCKRIRTTRRRLSVRLRELGFETTPSQANFVWTTHPSGEHRRIYDELKARQILVRLMSFPAAFGKQDSPPFTGLRITVGTDEQIEHLLENLEPIVRDLS